MPPWHDFKLRIVLFETDFGFGPMREENNRMNCALPLHPVHLPENGRICTAMRAAACRKTMSGKVGRTAGRVQ
ncbi:MAG: hypothetical protein ACT6RN_08130 [Agrobacterium sp.]|uniref:hypothetical protein n=1 Tax=Agrobacterium sp. TaxID=361 RepID=UPI0040377132